MVGVVRSYVLRRTQKGGHSSDKRLKKKTSIAKSMATFGMVRFAGTRATLQSGGSSKKRSNAIEAMRKQGMAIRKEAKGPVRKRGRPAKVLPSLPLLEEGHNEFGPEFDDLPEADEMQGDANLSESESEGLPDYGGTSFGLIVGSAEEGEKFGYNFHDDTDGHSLGALVTSDRFEETSWMNGEASDSDSEGSHASLKATAFFKAAASEDLDSGLADIDGDIADETGMFAFTDDTYQAFGLPELQFESLKASAILTALVDEDCGQDDVDADPSDLACLFASTGAAYQAFSPPEFPLTSTPSSTSSLRRTSRPLRQVASYAEDGIDKRAYETRDLDGKNVYDPVGTDEDFRLPNELVPVSHECNVLQMTECCPTTCERWGQEGCGNCDFRRGIEVVLKWLMNQGRGGVCVFAAILSRAHLYRSTTGK